jgi:CRISPR system Cascade subunit CasE
MHISKIQLRPEASATPAFWHGFQDLYHEHCQIWNLFADSEDRKRDFIYRREEHHGLPLFLAVSARLPLSSTAIWQVETKPYHPQLKVGQVLAFLLRANPIRSKRDDAGSQHRHDVVMEARTREKNAGRTERIAKPEIVQREGFAWLASRAARHGFQIKEGEVLADGYRQHTFPKRGGGRPIHLSTLDFSGVLEVTDPERFLKTLYEGLGPAKGFGCGLMLVKRQ